MDVWLNKTFLEDLLHKNSYGIAKVTVTDFHYKPAVSAGSNYLGKLHRVTVEYRIDNCEIETLQLIVKVLPGSSNILTFISEVKAFDKEEHFYRETIYGLQDVEDLVPRSYRSSAQAIILEDLVQQGFKMGDRLKGLDLQHLRLVIRAIARFHASSVALRLKDPDSMNVYGESVFREEDQHGFMAKYFLKQVTTLADGLELWQGYEKYAAKLKSILPTAMSRMTQAVKPKPGAFRVLNHCDLWVSNLLFHYDSTTGQVDRVKFVDFQALRFASPALDLQFFLYSSCNDDTRVKCFQSLLEEYHNQLIASFRKLGLNPEMYTLNQLKQDFEENKDFGFFTVCMVMSSMLTEDGPQEDQENVFNFEKTIASKRFREVFSSLIPYFERQGLL